MTGYRPITPGPRTSSTCPSPSVIIQCRDFNYQRSELEVIVRQRLTRHFFSRLSAATDIRMRYAQ
jgi:hypothetical protein